MKDDIFSRRDFLKKSAKRILPIIGCIVLASTPNVVKAMEKASMGCDYGCSMACHDGCSKSCQGRCVMTCFGGCNEGCHGQCRYSCFETCYYGSNL